MESGILAITILIASMGALGGAVWYMIRTFREINKQKELREGKPPIV